MNVLILIFTTVQMIKCVRIQLGVSSVHVEKDLYLEVMDQLVNVRITYTHHSLLLLSAIVVLCMLKLIFNFTDTKNDLRFYCYYSVPPSHTLLSNKVIPFLLFSVFSTTLS